MQTYQDLNVAGSINCLAIGGFRSFVRLQSRQSILLIHFIIITIIIIIVM